MANQAAGQDALVGHTLGHYRIAEKIGAGGMGEVFRAHDQHLDREVAIKVLPPGVLSDESSRKRFRKEALALSKLNHPNIATVHDFDTQQGVDFLVMEYIPGVTLENKLATGPLLPKEVVYLGIQLMQGLSAAHEQGIVHRDLKPANLRLTPDGRLKILDFGLAQLLPKASPLGLTATLTQSQEVTGTLPYMAPEQLRGELCDARSDVWAAGAVLYEMAVGKRPFPESNGPVLIDAILNQAPQPPSKVNREVSPGLQDVILKALEKDPGRRYQSVRELDADLERLTAGVSPLAKPRVRPRSRLIAAGVALLILGAVLGGYLFFRSRKSAGSLANVSVKHRPSVAVLGFKNLTGQPEAAWLSTALSEMFTTELGAGEQLRVISGENVARTKIDLSLPDAESLAQDTLTKIRQNLGSDVVVLGSYVDLGKESGGQIRLDLRVQETVAGETLPMVSESGTEKELFVLVSEAGAKLRKELGVETLSASESSSVQNSLPANPEAARLYSEGLTKLRFFDALAARDLLEKAVAADPSHALAHSALAAAWSSLGYDAKASQEAKKALDLSPNLVRENRLCVEGRYRETTKEWDKAIEVYRTLWIFFPDNLDYGLSLADMQISASKAKDALATIQALRMAPPPARDDPRIDLVEARAADALADFKRELLAAGNAAAKAQALGAGLLTARAKRLQGLGSYNLGQFQDALTLFGESKRIYTAAANWDGAAWATNNSANVVFDEGDVASATKMYEEALKIWQEIGNERGMAAAQNNIAGALLQQGDLAAAARMYEKTLTISRETNDKNWMAVALSNLGVVRFRQGDLRGANQIYGEALATSREIGDEAGVAALLIDVASALHLQGDLDGAAKTYDEALQVCQKIDYDTYRANVLKGLGEVLAARGDLVSARKKQEEALAIKNQLGEKAAAAEIRLALAQLAIDDKRPALAEAPAREAAEQFHQEKSPDSELSAHIILARSLLAQGKYSEAQEAIDRAKGLLSKSDLVTHLSLLITAARVLQVSGRHSDQLEAAKSLQSVLAEAKETGFVGCELEAGLALGEIELKLGNVVGAHRRLESIEKLASSRGFGLIAQKAAALSKGPD